MTTIPSNVHFFGGSTAQQNLIGSAHNLALRMAQNATRMSATGANIFTTWFGAADPSAVSNRFAQIAQIIGSSTFIYNIASVLPAQPDRELVFGIQTVSGDQLVVLPWKGIFLQPESSTDDITKQAAMTIVHLAVESLGMEDLLIARDRDGAQFMATWDPKTAVQSPRNYMYYAGSI